MAAAQSTAAPERTVLSPTRRLIAAGVKRGSGPLVTTPAMSVDVARAVTRYEIAAQRFAELASLDARDMTGAQFDSLALAQDTMAESRRLLEQAGQLHLIAMSENDRLAHEKASYVRRQPAKAAA